MNVIVKTLKCIFLRNNWFFLLFAANVVIEISEYLKKGSIEVLIILGLIDNINEEKFQVLLTNMAEIKFKL